MGGGRGWFPHKVKARDGRVRCDGRRGTGDGRVRRATADRRRAGAMRRATWDRRRAGAVRLATGDGRGRHATCDRRRAGAVRRATADRRRAGAVRRAMRGGGATGDARGQCDMRLATGDARERCDKRQATGDARGAMRRSVRTETCHPAPSLAKFFSRQHLISYGKTLTLHCYLFYPSINQISERNNADYRNTEAECFLVRG